MMLMLILPMRLKAQYRTTVTSQPTISFDITDIAQFDERVFFLYNLMTDGRFDIINSEREGVFFSFALQIRIVLPETTGRMDI